MVVLALHGDACTAYDAADVARLARLDKEQWVPLRTTIPERPTARVEHARGSTVLALWNPTGRADDWTTEFFSAAVVARPCDRAPGDARGYLLDFGHLGPADGRREIVVPEQFVVADSEGWLNAAV
jgi:hypothetical protein